MVLESAQLFLQPIVSVFSVLAAILSFRVLMKLSDGDGSEAGKEIRFVFQLLSFGFLLFAFAEIIYAVLVLSGLSSEISIADLFWLVGYVLLISGYSYFSFFMYKKHGRLGEGIPLISAAFLFCSWITYYLLSTYVYGFQEGQSSLSVFLDYAYPIGSTLTFVAAISVFLFLGKLSSIGNSFLALAMANGFDFIGNTLYTYYVWNDTYGIPGLVSDVSFVLFYFSAAAGLYLLLKANPNANV